MTVSPKNLALLVIAVLALAGCGVDNLNGIELATAAIRPTSTPSPTATPDPLAATLPNMATKEFLGTTITLGYPDGWQTDEGGQSLAIFNPDASVQSGFGVSGFGLTAFISLTRRLNLDTNAENLSALAMHSFVQEAVDNGFGPSDSVPSLEQIHSFDWGAHKAAIFSWHATDNSIAGVELVVLDSDQRRFVLFSAQSAVEAWPQFTPTLKAMVATVTLDGDVLPGSDLVAAFEAVDAG
jgi:hypothetical protein